MPANESMSDDVIAELLKKDARESSIKYSAMGLEAFMPKRPTINAPKPNTRFLRNIIKETDNHNAALRQRELDESRARLRTLKGEEQPSHRRARDPRSSHRADHHDEAGRHSKRRRVDHDDDEDSGSRGQHRDRDSCTSDDKRRSKERYSVRSRLATNESRSRSEDDGGDRATRRHHRHRSRSSEHSRHRETRHRRSTRRESRSRSRSRSPDAGRRRHHRYHHHHSRRKEAAGRSSSPRPSRRLTRQSPSQETSNHDEPSNLSDSDPLEAIIGPPPPVKAKVKSRGRGTFASSSAMDNHFDSNYDPSVDVQPNSESENDWDQALEALRDRQRWKQQGADRLRSAGFNEDEVSKWEKGGERTEEDVRWAKHGEGREWDRGKVVNDEGDVGIKVDLALGRLKGT